MLTEITSRRAGLYDSFAFLRPQRRPVAGHTRVVQPRARLLSYLVAALGSYAFLQFASRIAELRDAGLRFSWLAIGAIAMGGGIWAMHFIGMLAHILPIPVSYDPGITALSI
jgi:NO-binding membrane sensor protein with MHYT domain